MAFGSFRGEGAQRPVAEINVVPLVDVMLVLLVIFIVTAPLLTHAVKIDLPKASSQENLAAREHIQLAISADGTLHWNGEPADLATVDGRFNAAAQLEPQPEVHIRADGKVAYEHVAGVMSAAARAGLTRIGFVTDPHAP
jgi:biopolymer transport protein ExbD